MLTDQLQRCLDRRLDSSTLRRLTLVPSLNVDLSSNDYLGLAGNPEVKQQFMAEVARGDQLQGSRGSRLLDGNSQYSEDLERHIANFHRAESGLLFNSGFDANVSVFSCVPQPGDIVVYDEYIHASVHDGLKLSRASSKISFKHNSVKDLRLVLESVAVIVAKQPANVFVAVESVYSMDGDVAPLTQLLECMESTLPNDCGYLIVDEAHATGVCGPQGRGMVSQFCLESKALIRVHTFGKAMGCSGAIVLCSVLLRTYLINYARPLIYSTAMSFSSLAAIRVSYDFIQSPPAEKLRDRLWSLVHYFHERLASIASGSSLVHIDEGRPQSCILSLQCQYPRQLARQCQKLGITVRPIVSPTVPVGKERLRICIHAFNTNVQLDQMADAIDLWIQSKSQVGAKSKMAKL